MEGGGGGGGGGGGWANKLKADLVPAELQDWKKQKKWIHAGEKIQAAICRPTQTLQKSAAGSVCQVMQLVPRFEYE